MELDEAAAILSEVEFFSICDAEQLRLMAFTCEHLDRKSGTVLFSKGEPADGAYVLVHGTLEAQEGDGPTAKVRTIDARASLVGEMALILGRPRRARVTTTTDARLLFVPRTAFLRLLGQYPDLALRAAERIRREMGDYIRALDTVRHKVREGLRRR